MADQWSRIDLNVNGRLKKIARGGFFAIEAMTIARTPVDSGRYRGNWRSSKNAIDHGIMTRSLRTGEVDTGSNGLLFNFNFGDTFYMTNPLPYGPRLEYEGWSLQAPAGMVRISAAQWPRIVQQVARSIR